MSDAVAKLRFDLLADTGKMTGPLADAGTAAEKMAARFNKSFDSVKQSMQRAEREADAWKKSMQAEGSFLAGSMKFDAAPKMGGLPADKLVPWGDGFRKEISRQAAETAALLGKESTKLNGLLGSLLKVGEKVPGLGSILELGSAAAMNPVSALGTAGVAYHEYVAQKSEGMRDRARAAARSASEMGTNVETASRLNAVGFDPMVGARLQESIGKGSSGFADIGLDAKKLAAEPITQALDDVGKALRNAKDPATRAAAAVEIFGREGMEVLPMLAGLKDRMKEVGEAALVTDEKLQKTKRYDRAKRLADQAEEEAGDSVARGLGADEGIGTGFQRAKGAFFSGAWGYGSGAGDYWEKSQNAEDRAAHDAVNAKFAVGYKAQQAQEAAAKKAEDDRKKAIAEANQSIFDLGQSSAAGIDEARGTDQWGNHNAQRTKDLYKYGQAAGWSDNRIAAESRQQNAMVRQGQLVSEAQALGTGRTASERHAEDLAAIAAWQQSVAGGRPQGAVELGRMQKQADKNYLSALGVKDPMADFADQFGELLKADAAKTHGLIGRAASELALSTVAAVTDPLASMAENRGAQRDAIRKMREQGLGDKADRLQEQVTRGDLGALGIKRPEDEFKKQFQDLSDALGDHTITDKEFDKRKRELERQAAGEMTADVQTVSPVAAMAAGSREAYSLFARAANNSTKDDLQKAANATLRTSNG